MKTTVAFLLLLLSALWVQAQQCNGSLGDPIVNITFGSGAGTFGGERDSLTNYPYVAGTPNDGYYTIANSTSTMYGSWWHTTDHTGDSGGYMMIVNASYSKGIFYKQTIRGLCAGTTYEFAAWVLNLSNRNEIKPDINFSIETSSGANPTPVSTGPIDPNTQQVNWQRYSMLFTMPAGGGDITLIMSNNADGGIGNDIALDDITFRPCGPMLVSNFGTTGSSAPFNTCAGTSQSYTMSTQPTTGFINPAYQWQTLNGSTWIDIPGATTTTYTANFTPTDAGSYQYRLASAEAGNITSLRCRVVSNVLTLNINRPPSAINDSRQVCEDDPITLNASPGDTYSWTGPNGFTSTLQSPTILKAIPANAGTYNVVVTRSNCTTPAHIDVAVNPKAIATTGPDATICSGRNTTLQASGGTTYRWSPVTGLSDPTSPNPVASPQVSTTYTVTVTNASNCTATATQTVNVIPAPTADAGANQRITEGQSVTLQGTVSGSNISYYWTPSDFLSNPNILNPVASPKSDITYTLHVVSNDGCGFAPTDPVFIRVYKSVTVPNTFTPNNDGVNDTWNIDALDTYPESTTQVFNRYGEVVMQSKGYGKAWDGTTGGKPLPAGTYYYRIDLKNGKVLSGWVGIVR